VLAQQGAKLGDLGVQAANLRAEILLGRLATLGDRLQVLFALALSAPGSRAGRLGAPGTRPRATSGCLRQGQFAPSGESSRLRVSGVERTGRF